MAHKLIKILNLQDLKLFEERTNLKYKYLSLSYNKSKFMDKQSKIDCLKALELDIFKLETNIMIELKKKEYSYSSILSNSEDSCIQNEQLSLTF